ncbi:Hsp20/alpha crystallin family protein [Psychrobacillus sp. OK032]|uniref:Hsp20/alpha crystallin family protein n=1 Tax=Psychrobacillus sp. OK032 TaxID=1884358 RepID=UPI0008C63696|nr:Hsp20/alpha crystallin family protein [Psychrobacillus sp. OK032]SES17437.1 heat shock protein Hsp20 [Psychrobacillus sp. OK032]
MPFENDNLPTRNNDHLVNTSGFSEQPLWNFINQIDTFFNQFFQQMNTHLIADPLSVNTFENESNVIVEAKLPGCNRNQIQLEIVGNRLRIGVEDSLQEEVKYPTHTGRKQFYQRRERIVSLPFTIPEKEAKVSFENEILTISFPKESIKRRYLTIDDERV